MGAILENTVYAYVDFIVRLFFFPFYTSIEGFIY